ncbi:MAG: PBP1A family penicillin-binding protein [Christensenellaceae bacterium]|nr:PBP1A family penicillin-binding protein [Christensenellaceae bacterium]
MRSDKPRKKKNSLFFTVLKAILLAFALAATCFVLFFAVSLLKLDAWKEFDPENILGAPETLILYDKDDNEALRLHAAEDRVSVSISEVPKHVRMAFISAEDARFYEHPGVDLIRIAGAAWQDIKAGSYVQGASTITQQLIKLSHLSADKTISRKLEEAVLAYQMEKKYSKDEILEMYLNYVYFGRGYYGVEAAALGYFGTHASELSIAQAATLAGILKSPTNYAPHLKPDDCLRRRNNIISLMHEYGYISQEECDAAVAEPVKIQNVMEPSRGYYVDTALSTASDILAISMDELLTGGYRIYTAMDPALQAHCEEIFAEDSFFPAADCEGAIVIQQAGTGHVVALVGGRDSNVAMAFNRATRIRRQPGSVIKPVIAYAPALELCGYTAASMLLDEPTTFADYAPRNFNNKYYGWVTLREAVQRSLNVPAVKVLNEVGLGQGKAFAESLGVSFDKTDTSLTLALGGFTYGVSPWQLAGAYAAFASEGVYDAPTVIRYITDAAGRVLYEYEPESNRVMSKENAYILTSMLESAIEEGTGRRLGELELPIAGKTGTVGAGEGNRDAWMAAYNPEYAACVWMGYDNTEDGMLPADATGGKYPALVLREVFKFLYEGKTSPDFIMPDGVAEYALDKRTLTVEHTAVLSNSFTPQSSVLHEVFRTGTEPTITTQYWGVPAPVRDLAVTLSATQIPTVSFTARQPFIRYRLYREDAYGNNRMLIKEWIGQTGKVVFEDNMVSSGASYRYSVVPEHPELSVNGKQVCGPVKKTALVQVGEAEIILNDIEFSGDG